jgi:hypothetical protein
LVVRCVTVPMRGDETRHRGKNRSPRQPKTHRNASCLITAISSVQWRCHKRIPPASRVAGISRGGISPHHPAPAARARRPSSASPMESTRSIEAVFSQRGTDGGRRAVGAGAAGVGENRCRLKRREQGIPAASAM